MRTGCNSDDVWLSMDKCHIVHMNHSTLHWRLRRYGKVIWVGLTPPDMQISHKYKITNFYGYGEIYLPKVFTPFREAGTCRVRFPSFELGNVPY
jgi:hypothetical protein